MDKFFKKIPGIWDEEPNEIEWEEGQFICLIARQLEFGHLCGYVGVPSDHPLFEMNYMDIEDDIIDNELSFEFPHGGITFSNKIKEYGKERWFFGFDCAHSDDFMPYMSYQHIYQHKWDFVTYKTVDYVKSEVEKLIIFINNYTVRKRGNKNAK